MKKEMVVLATVLVLFNPITAFTKQSNVLFILDGSGSMWADLDGQPEIVIAKEVMTNVVQELPGSIGAGLLVYGHRSKGDCNDIEALVPVNSKERKVLIRRIESITPRGKTPITMALQQAADQLRILEDESTVVLVSDGRETCEGDPCKLVRDLRNQGIKIKVHVVGFDVNSEESEQLGCIADAGGGQYFSADSSSQLRQALIEVKEEVVSQPQKTAPVKKTKKVIKIATIGKITLPNLSSRKVQVCEQQSEHCGLHHDGYAGSIEPETKSLELPAGTYRLKFENQYVDGIQVGSGEEIVLDM